jgi:hypothetical protein
MIQTPASEYSYIDDSHIRFCINGTVKFEPLNFSSPHLPRPRFGGYCPRCRRCASSDGGFEHYQPQQRISIALLTMAFTRPIPGLVLSRPAARSILSPSLRLRRQSSNYATGSPFEIPLKTSRIPLRYGWYTLCLCIGAGAGFLVRDFATTRLDAPTPGSPEDDVALRALADQMDRLDIVRNMRSQSYNVHSDVPLGRTGQGKRGWIELDVKRTMSETPAEGTAHTRTLTSKTLGGIQGLGIQRAFWNAETRELIAVVWLGSRLSGWPGLAHGGAIATVFEDAMARMIAGPDQPVGMEAAFWRGGPCCLLTMP